jgi:hypothetical protein
MRVQRAEIRHFQASLFRQEAGGSGEPEWMPSPDEVTRARALMERRGVPVSLMQAPAGTQLVAPGETPWPWLLGAALWVIVWPAMLALRSSGQMTWLPLWLPLILAALHLVALIAPVRLAIRDSSTDSLRRRFGQVQTIAQMLALEPDEFEAWVGMLFTLGGYEVKNTQYVADHGVDLQVSGNGMRAGLVQCKRYRGTVGEPTVRDLYGTMIHEGADYAWLATTGDISRQAREWAYGKPIDLWDGQRLLALARKRR